MLTYQILPATFEERTAVTFEVSTARPAGRRVRYIVVFMSVAVLGLLAAFVLTTRADAATTAAATTPPPPAQDPFYTYTGSKPLSEIAPGTVLKTRTESYHVAGVSLPVTVIQLLYRSTTVRHQATTNVTSVLLPPDPSVTPKLVAYNSFYDSLNPDNDPSYVFAGAPYSSSDELITEETPSLAGLLLAGDTVDVADTEGSLNPDFAVGPAYGMYTLDGMRAALNSPAVGLTSATKLALMGYSGGSIATGWAAQMAPSYAPDIESRLIGATMGGVYVDPDHNIHYVEGSPEWAGVIPLALIGIAKAYDVNLTPYLSAYGQAVEANLSDAAIGTATDDYPDLTWQQIAKQPRYPQPETVAPFVKYANLLTLGRAALPKVPVQIVQGDNGILDGTQPGGPGIGPGDGVMVAGDVRSYAREVCASGEPVSYTELPLSHETAEPVWSAAAVSWLAARFAGSPAPQDCATIAPGNSLAPVTQTAP
jgi:hypothetical protein